MCVFAKRFARVMWLCAWFIPLLSGCEAEYGGKIMSAADAFRASQLAEAKDQAEMHAEANADYISAADEQRIATMLAARSAQEQHELAEYARFQFNQRLALAEASAPRIYMSPESNSDEDTAAAIESERRGPMLAVNGNATLHGRTQGAYNTGDDTDRLYVRGVLENSADQSVADSANREAEPADNTDGLPFGQPVPGNPGFVTSPTAPTSGYIDVRGFEPGSEVVDPYTRRPMRVP